MEKPHDLVLKTLQGKIKEEYRPTIFNLKNKRDVKVFSALIKSGKIGRIVDTYVSQLQECFEIQNPVLVHSNDFKKKFDFFLKEVGKDSPLWQQGAWVWYSWISTLVHILPEKEFFLVRTARNKNLIKNDEQTDFYNSVIGVAGLSVGNSIALTIVLEGGAKHIRLADSDNLTLSNTNRIRTGISNLGIKKVIMTARQIYEINPYAIVEIFKDGLTRKNISTFFNKQPKLNIVIDEIDSFGAKYLIRKWAQKLQIPLITGADNGEGVSLDIERYDLDKNTPFFNGRLGRINYGALEALSKFEIGKSIVRLIGIENIPHRLIESFFQMGKTLVSWPQLGSAATLNGAIVSYVARQVLRGKRFKHQRMLFSLEKLMPVGHHDSLKEERRQIESTKKFRKLLGL